MASQLSFAELNETAEETLKRVVVEMFSLNTTSEKREDLLLRYKPNQRWAIIYILLTDYINLQETTKEQRSKAGESILFFYNANLLTDNDIQHGYMQFKEIAQDIMYDVPYIWKYVTQFSGPLLFEGIIKLNDIYIEKLRGIYGERFAEQVILVLCEEFGPYFVRKSWKLSGMRWKLFLSEKTDVKAFIEDKKFGFMKYRQAPPTAKLMPDMSRINSRLKVLLEMNASKTAFIDYVNGNVLDMSNKDFIFGLTTTILRQSIVETMVNDKPKIILNMKEIRKIGMDLLLYFIDMKLDREVECIYAIQRLVCELEFPQQLLETIFIEFYNFDILCYEAFKNWKDSKLHPVLKGVALKSVVSFFAKIAVTSNDETHDHESERNTDDIES